MKFTLIAPIYNEGDNVKNFLNSISLQTRKPDEIILVDGGSTDNTFEILKEEEKKYDRLKVFQLTGDNIRIGNIAKNRNLAIKKSTYEIILCIDAGGIVDIDYCKYMMEAFEENDVDVVGGNYNLIYKSNFQKNTNKILELGKRFGNIDFNPSSRSIGFKRKVWEEIGGYPEYLTMAGEDTYFNYLIKKNKYKLFFQKKAIVSWDGREDLKGLLRQVYFYNKGDAEVFIINGVIQNNGLYFTLIITIYVLLLIYLILIFNFIYGLILLLLFLFFLIFFNYKKMGGSIFFKIKINFLKVYNLYIGYIDGLVYGVKYLLMNKKGK